MQDRQVSGVPHAGVSAVAASTTRVVVIFVVAPDVKETPAVIFGFIAVVKATVASVVDCTVETGACVAPVGGEASAEGSCSDVGGSVVPTGD